ncbi:hypothetical protein AB0O67_29290 [Streptomyces sp. NPDC086077]|uniref:hypothetical protein n=1 Tax=Streptomyces sp. NPDC086077 TaxID=3154862 RepID=UPI003414D9AC
MDLRRATRDIVLVLDDARDCFTSEDFDVRPFMEALNAAVAEARSAADGCAIYGLHFSHTPSTPEMHGRQTPTPETRALRELLELAYRTSTAIKHVLWDNHRTDRDLERVSIYCEAAGSHRSILVGILLERMEELREGASLPSSSRRWLLPRTPN